MVSPWAEALSALISWLVPAACAGLAGWAAAQVKSARREQGKQRERDDAVRAGVQALLRDRIYWAHDHYRTKGEYPIYARENVEEMYRSYHALGGNGTVTNLVRELDALPTKKG